MATKAATDYPAGVTGRSEPRSGPVAHHVTWKRYPDRIEMACQCGWAPVLEPHHGNERLEMLACMHGGCWADPLTRRERLALARKLSRACKRSGDARWTVTSPEAQAALLAISADCAALHLDVTERAA